MALIVPALLWPSSLRIPNRAWRALSHAMGWVNTRVILSAMYAVILTPAALVGRLAGWDPLCRRWPQTGSGWLPYPKGHQDPKHYERMY